MDWFALEFFKDIVWWNEAIVSGEGFKVKEQQELKKNPEGFSSNSAKKRRMRGQ